MQGFLADDPRMVEEQPAGVDGTDDAPAAHHVDTPAEVLALLEESMGNCDDAEVEHAEPSADETHNPTVTDVIGGLGMTAIAEPTDRLRHAPDEGPP
jgi:hypothetical protein